MPTWHRWVQTCAYIELAEVDTIASSFADFPSPPLPQFASAVPEVLLWPRERIRGSLQDSCRHMGGDARVLSRVAAVAPVLCVRPGDAELLPSHGYQ